MSPRTLPVTPAERACATVLRACNTWQNTSDGLAAGQDEREYRKRGDLLKDWIADLHDAGWLDARLDLTPAGAALLARVEAAERTEIKSTLAALRASISNPPDGDDDAWRAQMTRALRAHEAALAGTTPIDAPPAKEPT